MRANPLTLPRIAQSRATIPCQSLHNRPAGPRPGTVPGRGRARLVQLRHHVLDLRVVLERVGGEIRAVARLLVAPVRHLRDERDVVVDPDRPELELARGVERTADVARPDRGGEPVVDVVRPRDRLVVIGEALNGHDRAEDLPLDDLVLLTDLRDDRRVDEEAAGAVRPPAGEHLRTLRAIEEPEHALLLRARDHRPHLDLLPLGRVADVERLDRRYELVEQLLVDPRTGEDARGGGAVL